MVHMACGVTPGAAPSWGKRALKNRRHLCLLQTCLYQMSETQLHLSYMRLSFSHKFLPDIKSRLKSGNACYRSMQNLLSSSLLSKNIKIKIYRNIILSVVLYGCGISSLTVREKCRLRVFENRVLRRIFGPKRSEVTGEWRKLHNEELNDLYSSPNIRVIK